MWTRTLATVLVLGTALPSLVQANSDTCSPAGKPTKRPLSDFLNKQGTSGGTYFHSIPDCHSPHCPYIPDYVGWIDNPPEIFALVDYAGIAAKSIADAKDLNTQVTGFVVQTPCKNNKDKRAKIQAKIQVEIYTRNALGFAQSVATLGAPPWTDIPTIFGATAAHVANGSAPPALGWAMLQTSFTIGKPGDDLPDFLSVVNTPTYAPAEFRFQSVTFEERAAKGRPALLRVQQTGETAADGTMTFGKEIVDIVGIDD